MKEGIISYKFSSASRSCLSSLRFRLSLTDRVKSFLSTTTPRSDGGALSDASLTSPAFSPKMALNSFSSGVGSDSPFGVIFPIKMSPVLVYVPTPVSYTHLTLPTILLV